MPSVFNGNGTEYLAHHGGASRRVCPCGVRMRLQSVCACHAVTVCACGPKYYAHATPSGMRMRCHNGMRMRPHVVCACDAIDLHREFHALLWRVEASLLYPENVRLVSSQISNRSSKCLSNLPPVDAESLCAPSRPSLGGVLRRLD